MATSNGVFAITVFCLFGLAQSATSNFLTQGGLLNEKSMQPLLADVEETLGVGHNHLSNARIEPIMEFMRHTFAAMVKNENNRLGHSGVRYILHRFFVQRHGWFVSGLDAAGDLWDVSAPTDIFSGRVPILLKESFESRIAKGGLDVKEIAVLAATLEHLVHVEAVERLRAAYRAHELPLEGTVSDRVAREVVDTFMASYISGTPIDGVTSSQLHTLHHKVRRAFMWSATQEFVQRIHRNLLPEGGLCTFENVSRVVEEVADQYGRFQNGECHDIKNSLISLEGHKGSGRVPLSAFYGSGIRNFDESPEYLRSLGALEESRKGHAVIIPNYILGPNNCLASSSYYAVCCMDECENLFVNLERDIGAPEAPVSLIVHLVSKLSSRSQPANRTLSSSLLQRLKDIADHHDGQVPLHGRLFEQWMHYAYPRECRYPHVAGTKKPLSPMDWKASTGLQFWVSPEERKRHAAMQSQSSASEEVEESESLMWSMHEQLVVTDDPARKSLPYESILSFLTFVVVFSGWMWAGSSVMADVAKTSKRTCHLS